MKKAQTIYTLIKFTTASGGPLNITNGTVTLMIKESENDIDADAIISKTGTILDAVNGLAKVELTPTEANGIPSTPLVAEGMVVFADGNLHRTKTLKTFFEPNVIKAIA